MQSITNLFVFAYSDCCNAFPPALPEAEKDKAPTQSLTDWPGLEAAGILTARPGSGLT